MRRRGGRTWVPATWPFDVWYPRGRIVHRCKRNLGTGIDDNQNTKTKRTAQQRGMFTRRSKRENLKEWKCVQYAFYTSYAASMSINQIVPDSLPQGCSLYTTILPKCTNPCTWHHDAQQLIHFWKFHDRNVPPNSAELLVNEVLPLTMIVELDANRAPDHHEKRC